MLLRWIIIVALVHASQQKCSIGCLSCNSTDHCQYCDPVSQYRMISGVCVNSTRLGCEWTDQLGQCNLCSVGFYLDVVTRVCLQVPADKIQPNCDHYSPTLACTFCKKGFSNEKGKCVAVTTVIQNCWVYNSLTECGVCEKGSIKSPFNSTQCISITKPEQNCLGYNFLSCRKCKDGMVLVSKQPQIWTNERSLFDLFTSTVSSPLFSEGLFGRALASKSCYAKVVGCDPLSNELCSGCPADQYWDKNQCHKYPDPRIEYCQTYSDLVTCTSCMNGYFLQSNLCKAVVPIVNCVTYNGSVSTSVCVECKTGYFVSGNLCVDRTKKDIKNCIAYNLSADQCLTCDVGSMVTTQKLGCLFSIDHCVIYAATAEDALKHNCSACRDGYYLETVNGQTVCSKGNVAYCSKYLQNQINKCSLCVNGYYVVDDMCKPHVSIDNCITYDPNTPHLCQKCQNGFIKLEIQNVCVKGKPIPNCKVRKTDLSGCDECQPKFFRNGITLMCDPIPISLGYCENSSDGSSCNKCAEGKVLFKYPTYNTCLNPPEFITAFGLVSPQLTESVWDPTSSDLTPLDGICSDFSYPVELKANDGFCVGNTQLKFIYAFNTIVNCRRYSWNPFMTSIFCSECNEGYFIKDYNDLTGLTGDLSCTKECDLSTNVIILNDLLGIYNICAPRSTIDWTVVGMSSTSCQIAVRTKITTIGLDWVPLAYSKTLKCLKYDLSTTVAVWGSVDPLSYNYETALVNNSNSYNTGIPFFGYHFSDSKPKPFAFNYAGFSTTPALKSSVFIPALTANCNVYFEMKFGSAYASSGRDSTLIQMSTAKKDLVCLQCEFGYMPKFTEKINSLWVYAPKCNPTVGDVCNKSIVSGGLPSYLNAVLSCHSCVNDFRLRLKFEMLWSTPFQVPNAPTVYSTTQNKGFFLQYRFSSTVDPLQCHNPSTVVPLFNIDNPASTTTNSDCGVFADISRLEDIEKIASETKSFCLACRSGYAPFYFKEDGVDVASVSLPTYIVKTCTKILNCDETSLNKPFNSCGKCIAQQVVPVSQDPFYAFEDLLMRSCLSSKTNFCFVLKPSSADCMVCQAGYFLNIEGYCDAIVLPNMQEGATFNSALDFQTLKSDLLNPLLVSQSSSDPEYSTVLNKALQTEIMYIRLQYLLSFTNLPNGPTLCRSDYSIVPRSKNMNSVCGFSTTLKTGSFATSTSFIPNCQNYFNSLPNFIAQSFCAKCAGSFVVTDNYATCVDPIPNCSIASTSDQTKCSKCDKGYSNLNGVCVTPQIQNCVSYDPQENISDNLSLTCAQCIDEHYYDNTQNQCIRDPSLNCKKFLPGSNSWCVECIRGFNLATLKDLVFPVCLPIAGMYENCNKIQSWNGSSGKYLSCDECSYSENEAYASVSANSLLSQNNPKNVCLYVNSIDNCLVYDISDDGFSQTSPRCLECVSGFFASSNSCVRRSYVFEGCSEYHKTQDTCLSCVPGLLFVQSYFPQCVSNPQGVPKCTKYSNASTCVKCEKGYYLSNNLCLLSTERSDCEEYSSNYTCSVCRSNYFLNSTGSCITTNATNCETIASVTACASCSSGKGLKKETVEGVELTNCVDINIENCLESSKVFPFKCLICNTNYYAFNDTCTSVDPLIANCLLYETATLCSQCNEGSSLSADKKKCESGDWVDDLKDSDCAKLETLVNPSCSACKFGYTRVNGVCELVSKENPLCMIFDLQETSACVLCQPKISWMNSKRFCVSIVPATIFVPTPVAFEFLKRTLALTLLFALMN